MSRPLRLTNWLIALFLVIFPGCDGWEIFPSEEPLASDEAYRLSILNKEMCPLPEGLDAKKVLIHSYNVRLRGQHPGSVPANYFYASLLTTDGSRYIAGYEGCEPLLSGPPLGPGESAEGYLNFPVPPGKVPAKLAYAPALAGNEVEEVLIELGLNEKPAREANEGDPADEDLPP